MKPYSIFRFSDYCRAVNEVNKEQQFNMSYTFQGAQGEYKFLLADDLNLGWLLLPDKSNITIRAQALLDNPDNSPLNKFEDGQVTQWLYNILSRSEFRIYL